MCQNESLFVGLSYIRKTYVDQSPKPQVGSNRLKSAPPHLLVRYSAHIVWHNVSLLNHIPHIIEHHIKDLAENPTPSPPPQEQGNFFRVDLSISCNFKQLCFSWQKSPSPPPPPKEQGKFFYTGSIHFMEFQATLVQLAEKPPPPQEQGKIF